MMLDFDNIALNNTPPHLRKLVRMEWLKVLVSGLKAIHDDFQSFREQVNYDLAFNGQTIYMEKLLNDRWDPSGSGIEIVNMDPAEYVFVSNTGSGHENPLVGNTGNSNNFYLGDNNYYDNIADFEVRVPAAIYATLDQAEMRALLDKYVFSSIIYKIVSK